MPELWLKYGTTEVVLDIKTENLLDYVIQDEQRMSEEEINAKLDSVTLKDEAYFVVLDTSLHTAKLSLLLVENAKKRSIGGISIGVPQSALNMYRNIFQDTSVSVSELSNDLVSLNTAILVSKTSFDPLFGYSGAPIYLLKYFGTKEMLDAYKARDSDLPRPGANNNVLSIAHEFAEKLDIVSIESVVGSHGFVDIIVNNPVNCNKEAITILESFNRIEVEKSKASIISAGDGYSTLSYALNSLWNCLDATKENGTLTLLAECRDGFGSTALQMLVEGKITMDDAYRPTEYIDGLENLLYLKEVSKRYNLSLVSALPDYYTKNRLGFKTFRRTKDVLQSLLNVYGPKQKVLVVSDASKVLLKPKMPD